MVPVEGAHSSPGALAAASVGELVSLAATRAKCAELPRRRVSVKCAELPHAVPLLCGAATQQRHRVGLLM